MEAVKNVPQLRFSGFEQIWKKESIGKYIDLISGYAFKSEEITTNKKGIPILRGINITEGYIRHNEKIDRYFLGEKDKYTKFLVNEGDLVLGMDGSKVGKNSAIISHSDVGSLLIQRVARLRAKPESSLPFIYHHINSFKFHRYVDIVNTSSGIPHISSKQINEFKIFFPESIEEQQKIANFLSSVDKYLSQLKEKKDLLEQYKKGMMQQLFSQQIRFKDENGEDFPEWEEKKLGEVCSFFSGGTPKSSNKKYYTGSIPFIGSGNIHDREVFSFISTEALETSSAKMVNKGDLLYALYGANSGDIAISKIEGAINQAILCIRTNENKMFLFFSLLKSKETIVSKFLQGGQGNLSAQIVKKLKFEFPSLPEQQKIANFLSAMDKKIDQVNTQIEASEQYKKGLLQQLFV